MICVKFTAFCGLRIRLATLLQTCVDLRRLAGPFGQGFRRAKHKASVMFKVTNKKAPEYLSEMFTKVEETNPLLSSSLRVSMSFSFLFLSFSLVLFCFYVRAWHFGKLVSSLPRQNRTENGDKFPKERVSWSRISFWNTSFAS